eukprot:TRINITY_DN143_c0_g2_i15.p1 TRINITY_DN143_c0_g2~~TRINITY_DN143_c0_g2_i15.p1  ORF type:complete len:284 (-),score=125.44 TRINITY_DN143_c0_g2_i15:199-981(-)
MAGMKETLKAAEAGMSLFAKEDEVEYDVAGATAYKDDHEAKIKEKEDYAATLTGKDNKKARTEAGKEVSALKADEKYVDACKVVKGLAPPKGNFIKSVVKGDAPKATEAAAPQAAAKKEEAKKEEPKKDAKKPGKAESAGISKAERDELEKLKKDIIARKADLKAQGMSGGQCNKDEQVVAWVARMTELKIKEDPTLAEGDKKKDDKKEKKKPASEEKMALEKKMEEYRMQLKADFGYSDKDIKADPDMQDMVKALSKLK